MRRFPIFVLAALMALAALVVPGPPAAQAAERTVTYTVSSQGAVQGDLGHFAAVARDALTDPRGWSLGGTLAFQQVPGAGDFDLILASPSVVANASPGCSARWSCRVGRSVYINDERWRFGTASWPHGLDLYQRYVILHEVGHWIGIPHTDCPTPGRTAWVMQQQSISLQGCRANVWPVLAEREQAGRRMGVPVAWSAVESHYRAWGGDGGLLAPPITWEQDTPDGQGRYQSFAGGYGGSGIYWHPAHGVHEVYGDIYDRWTALGREQGLVGYPWTGELPTPDGRGRYQEFTGTGGGGIYWRPDLGAHEVYGAIHDRWTALAREQGPLGYPVSGEYEVPGGRRSDFERGHIRWDRATGTTEVVITG